MTPHPFRYCCANDLAGETTALRLPGHFWRARDAPRRWGAPGPGTSRSRWLARNSIVTISSRESRTRRTSRVIRCPNGRLAASADTAASAAKASSSRPVMPGFCPLSTSATRTIGPNSPMLPTAKTCRPHRRAKDATVAKDRQESRQRGRTQGKPRDDLAVTVPAQQDDHPHHGQKRQRQRPAAGGQLERLTAQEGQVKFGAGQKHQQRQTEIGEVEYGAGRRHPVQHLRTDKDPERDLDHGARDGQRSAQFGQHRGQHRRYGNECGLGYQRGRHGEEPKPLIGRET